MLRPIFLWFALFLGSTDAAPPKQDPANGDPEKRSCTSGHKGQYYPVPTGGALWFPARAEYKKEAAETFNAATKAIGSEIQVGSFRFYTRRISIHRHECVERLRVESQRGCRGYESLSVSVLTFSLVSLRESTAQHHGKRRAHVVCDHLSLWCSCFSWFL